MLLSLILFQAIHEKILSMDLQRVHCKIKQVDSDLTLGQGITIQVRASLIVILARILELTLKHVLLHGNQVFQQVYIVCVYYTCIYR